ncbi:MAG: transporter substrate-binding domain-containing protein, partial [Oscillospiraceae bacterium]|nr:transporter substrate-binding domain-containing protein [Oscillospiraceae bacterium]
MKRNPIKVKEEISPKGGLCPSVGRILTITKAIVSLLLCIIFISGVAAGLSGCNSGGRAVSNRFNQAEPPVRYTSYKDIPGLSADELREAEALLARMKEQGESFTYGMMLSTEAFENSRGGISGYSALVCDWLSELFGVPFVLEHYTWAQLLEGLESGEIDFTGTLTATEDRRKTYFMSDPISQRSIRYFRLTGSEPLSEIVKSRLPRYALLQGTVSAANVQRYATYEFEAVFVAEYSQAYELLKSGEIDALLGESSAEAIFDIHGDIVTKPFLPLIYSPVSFSAHSPGLEVIVDIVQKAIESNGGDYLNELYREGHQQYLTHKLFLMLTEEESEYIRQNPTIRFGAEYDNYPASYFNLRESKWGGICFDVLEEIAALTGVTFEIANDESTEWPALLEMLTKGEIPFVSELIRSPEREGHYLWTDYPFLTDRSVLISTVGYPNISMNNVHTVRVGLSRTTAHTEFFNTLFPNHENVIVYDGQEDAIAALSRAEVDMVMSSYSTLLYLTNYLEFPDYKANIIFDNDFDSGFGFHIDEAVLQSIFNKSLSLIDTRIISEQWMHRRYDYMLSIAQAQRPWLIGVTVLSVCVLSLVVAFLIISIRAGKRLGKLVEERTGELALQTATLTAVFDTIPNHIFTKDLNSRYINCNKSLVEHFGLVKENIIGKDDVSGLGISEELAEKFIEEDNKAITEGQPVVKVEIVPSVSGEMPLYEIIKMPLIVAGETVGVIGMSQDITERVRREQQSKLILEYANKLNTALTTITQSQAISAGDLMNAADIVAREGCEALNASNIGVWFLSENKPFLKNISYYCNKSSKHSVLADFDLQSRKEYAKLLRTERLIVMNSIEECSLIDYNSGESGEEAALCLCAALDAPIHIEGSVVGVVCVEQFGCEEYTAGREWTIEEQNFASSLADLMALAISGFERRKAQQEAEIANKSKSTFLANMSHEIRTPMNAIIGITEILLQNEHLADETEEGLDKIYNSCDMLLGIINDILDFSKIEAGKLDIIPVQYSVASLINDSVQLNLMRLGDKAIDFEVEIDENVRATLVGDELRIKQVLNNLLSNAFKYTDTGKITLTITSETAEVDRFAVLGIKVSDTGKGMSEEQVNELFTEYIRFSQETNSKVEGTGLGLCITQRLVNLMDGTISVESEPGKGSLFTVGLMQGAVNNPDGTYEVIGTQVAENLRRFRNNYLTNKKRGQVVREPMPYGNILVVDDVETNLYVAIGLMKPYKIMVDTASSGGEAIEKVKEKIAEGGKYDVIFMDHMMPEMDGIEATGRIRALGYEEPIVALTANAVAGQADVFLKSGFDEFISKPIDTRRLNIILNKHIRDKQPPEVIEAARQQSQNTREGGGEEGAKGSGGADAVMLESFVRDGRKTVDALAQIIEKSGFEGNENALQKFTVFVHGIKSALWNIGEKELYKAAAELETGGREMRVDLLRMSAPVFLKELRSLVDKLETQSARRGEAQSASSGQLSAENLLALHEMCGDYNRKGALDLLTETGVNTPFVSELKELLQHSEFEEAQ